MLFIDRLGCYRPHRPPTSVITSQGIRAIGPRGPRISFLGLKRSQDFGLRCFAQFFRWHFTQFGD